MFRYTRTRLDPPRVFSRTDSPLFAQPRTDKTRRPAIYNPALYTRSARPRCSVARSRSSESRLRFRLGRRIRVSSRRRTEFLRGSPRAPLITRVIADFLGRARARARESPEEFVDSDRGVTRSRKRAPLESRWNGHVLTLISRWKGRVRVWSRPDGGSGQLLALRARSQVAIVCRNAGHERTLDGETSRDDILFSARRGETRDDHISRMIG